MIKFVPLAPCRHLPALFAGLNREREDEFVFQAIDRDGEVQIETFHATFPDALRAVAQTMEIHLLGQKRGAVPYTVELEE